MGPASHVQIQRRDDVGHGRNLSQTKLKLEVTLVCGMNKESCVIARIH